MRFAIKTNKRNSRERRKIQENKRKANNVAKKYQLSFAYHELGLHSERSCWGAEVDVIIVETYLQILTLIDQHWQHLAIKYRVRSAHLWWLEQIFFYLSLQKNFRIDN